MRNSVRLFTITKRRLLLVLLPCVLFVVTDSSPKAQASEARINVVTSIFPLKEFAKSVLGDRGDVFQLLPPGAEIHTWSPKPTDLIRLSNADVFIYMSENLEPWAHDILKSLENRKLTVIEMDAGNEGHVHSVGEEHVGHEEVDPHIWLDFSRDLVMLDRIVDVLTAHSPENGEYFAANASEYKHSLQRLDQEYINALKECSQKTFILGGHAAFGHLAQRYGLTQVSLYGLSPDSQPKPRQLARATDLARKLNVKVIFFEMFVSSKLAKVLAREAGAEVRILNPGVNLSFAQIKEGLTFLKIMEDNLANLKYGLNCQRK